LQSYIPLTLPFCKALDMAFTPLLPTLPTKRSSSSRSAFAVLIRDQLPITTWLALGAFVQSCALLLIGRIALAPAFAYLAVSALDTLLVSMGWRANKLMDGVLRQKYSAQIPDEHGNYGEKAANSDVVVFHVGARCNHPLGILAPGFREMGEYFATVVGTLDDKRDDFGMLGTSSWLSASQRSAGNETMQVYYFRDLEGLLKFAKSEYHAKAWAWYNKVGAKKYPYLTIYHETFHVPKGHWETVYVNSHINNLASATVKTINEKTGEVEWASTIVDAKKGVLMSAAGRLGRTQGQDNDDLTFENVYE
jgi:hypothetical protein